MGNAFRVLGRDVMRLLKSPAALVVAAVLVVLPSLYTWFNVVGFWDPYGNTGNLRVCVVNEDAGTDSDLVGRLDLGSQIVDTLGENTQLGWEFTDYDDAMDQVSSGEAYAAFVIPEDFSADLMTLLTGDFEQPNLQYYVNEKENPVSPKITDAGSTTLDETINSQFVSTVSEVVADVFTERLAEADANLDEAESSVAAQLGQARSSVSQAWQTVAALVADAAGAGTAAQDAKASLQTARDDAAALQSQLQQVSDLAGTLQNSVATFTTTVMPAASEGSLLLSQAATSTSGAVADAAGRVSAAKGTVDSAISGAQGVADANAAVIARLQAVVDGMAEGDAGKEQLQQVLAALAQDSAASQQRIEGLQRVSDSVGSTSSAIAAASGTLDAAVQGATAAANGYQTQLFGTSLPGVTSGVAQVGAAAQTLKAAIGSQGYLIDQTAAVLDQLSGTLGTAQEALGQTDGILAGLEESLGTAQTDVQALSTSTALSDLLDGGSIDPAKIAEFMASPTQVTTEKLYPLNAYGSAMAPLFMNLSLWVGAVMLCVILRLGVDREGIANLTVLQGFVGRWMLFAVLASLQAVVCCTGCLAIGVQCESVAAFYLTAIVMSLTYLSIVYSLSVLLQHVGIGICIIMVFVQIPGATGLYPIEMTTGFFQVVYPLFPFTYGINALRETIAGFYGTQYVHYLGMLLLCLVVTSAVAILVRPHLTNLNRLVAKEVEKSDLLNGESAEVPPRRYRVGQLIRALSDRAEFHGAMQRQAARFLRLYPLFKRGAVVVGIVVPVAVTVLFAVTTGEKVAMLTAWLIWLAVVIAFLLAVETVRVNIERKVSLDAMSDEELRGLLSARGRRFTRELVAEGAGAAAAAAPVASAPMAAPAPVATPVQDEAADGAPGAGEGKEDRHA